MRVLRSEPEGNVVACLCCGQPLFATLEGALDFTIGKQKRFFVPGTSAAVLGQRRRPSYKNVLFRINRTVPTLATTLERVFQDYSVDEYSVSVRFEANNSASLGARRWGSISLPP